METCIRVFQIAAEKLSEPGQAVGERVPVQTQRSGRAGLAALFAEIGVQCSSKFSVMDPVVFQKHPDIGMDGIRFLSPGQVIQCAAPGVLPEIVQQDFRGHVL